MSEHIDYQIIMHQGEPAYVLVPIEEFERLRPALARAQALEQGVPDQVVRAVVMDDVPIILAWREYLKLTQAEVARRMGISQSAFAQMEAPGARPRRTTLRKLALALGLSVEQLDIAGK